MKARVGTFVKVFLALIIALLFVYASPMLFWVAGVGETVDIDIASGRMRERFNIFRVPVHERSYNTQLSEFLAPATQLGGEWRTVTVRPLRLPKCVPQMKLYIDTQYGDIP